MSTELVCCSPDDDVEVAEELMSQYKKSRIICADERRRPVGVISLSDIAQLDHGEQAAKVLASISSREARVA